MNTLLRTLILSMATAVAAAAAEPKPLFDGKSLDGWDGDTSLWRVEDGCITGGSLEKTVPQNEFLATKAEYDHFVLRLKFKLTGTSGFVNSGVQIRSQRDPKSSEMIGYQCDIGDPAWWGCIYDESRRNRVMAQSDMKALEPVLKRNDWNEYEIRAEGPRIVTRINGVTAVDYTEKEDGIPQRGRIGIQVHGGGATLIQVRDITIEELPAPKKPAEPEGAPDPPAPASPSPQSPKDEQASFSLPPGFEIELVAEEEEGIGKFVAVQWDTAGRLWSMTALEYPVDANESRAEAEALFANGGRDRVVVFDNPEQPGPLRPRVWADNLAMPLGILPYKEGCYVQYGPDIRFYRDTDGDGRADSHDVVLTGFGIDDSHLFPHQFTFAPDGWIYLAQGAFNHGDVRRPDGNPLTTGGLFSKGADSVRFEFCKLARMRPDGSDFQLVSSGPNNIWGLVVARDGRMFVQEANDLGYPVVPFVPGLHLPGIGDDKLRPYAPIAPQTVAPAQMGGTGLSGLALSESLDGWPTPYGRASPPDSDTAAAANASMVFYVANPITSRIQMVMADPDAETGGYRFRKLDDFCLSGDPWFRPVTIAFGPDNCLYVVDWYNKIISHNEVPRAHPDRDKTRGRIWRIRHTGQPRGDPVDLTKLTPPQLAEKLASPNAVVAGLARRELAVRNLAPPPPPLPPGPTSTILTLGEAMQKNGPDAASLAGILRAADGDRSEYETNFRRFLARAFCEMWPEAVAALLDSPDAAALPVECRMLAALSLPPAPSAVRVAGILSILDRQPDDEELLRLTDGLDRPEIAAALGKLVARPPVLESLLRVRSRLPADRIRPVLTGIARNLCAGNNDDRTLAARLAGAFALRDIEPELLHVLTVGDAEVQSVVLDAFAGLRGSRPEAFVPFAAAGSPLRARALAAIGAADSPNAADIVLQLAPGLTTTELRAALDRLTSHPPGAAAVAAAFLANRLPDDLLDGATLDRMQSTLGPDNAALRSLLDSRAALFRHVLTLDGDDNSIVRTDISLEGPFTVECWVRLDGKLTNADSILGGPDTADFNFHDGRFRVYCGGEIHDAIVATTPIAPGAWTHVAVTRNEAGRFRLYRNGEPDPAEGRAFPGRLGPMQIGGSRAPGGTAGSLAEFRVWNRERPPEEIHSDFSRTLEGESPDGLTLLLAGERWGTLEGGARVARTSEFPPLMSPVEAREFDDSLARYVALAGEPGDARAGRLVFATCLTCHTIGGSGIALGPPLDGSAARPVEHLLRAILTPNAAVEGGYRIFRVRSKSGELTEGFLVRQDTDATVVRMIGGAEKRIEAADIDTAGYLNRSLMSAMYPVAFQALPDQSVRDLFAWIRTLQ